MNENENSLCMEKTVSHVVQPSSMTPNGFLTGLLYFVAPQPSWVDILCMTSHCDINLGQ